MYSLPVVFLLIAAVSCDNCKSCTTAGIVLTAPAQPGDIPAVIRNVSTDKSACVTASAVCIPTAGQFTYMQFNKEIGGPAVASNGEVTADLVCSKEGKWTFTMSGATLIITEVGCAQAKTPVPSLPTM